MNEKGPHLEELSADLSLLRRYQKQESREEGTTISLNGAVLRILEHAMQLLDAGESLESVKIIVEALNEVIETEDLVSPDPKDKAPPDVRRKRMSRRLAELLEEYRERDEKGSSSSTPQDTPKESPEEHQKRLHLQIHNLIGQSVDTLKLIRANAKRLSEARKKNMTPHILEIYLEEDVLRGIERVRVIIGECVERFPRYNARSESYLSEIRDHLRAVEGLLPSKGEIQADQISAKQMDYIKVAARRALIALGMKKWQIEQARDNPDTELTASEETIMDLAETIADKKPPAKKRGKKNGSKRARKRADRNRARKRDESTQKRRGRW